MSRKRRRSDSGSTETSPKRQRLTFEALSRFNKDIGTRDTGASMDSQSSISQLTVEPATINAYSFKFDAELRRRRVFFIDEETDHAPSNLASFKSAIFMPRASPEPTDDDSANIRKRVRKSCNEAATLQNLIFAVMSVTYYGFTIVREKEMLSSFINHANGNGNGIELIGDDELKLVSEEGVGPAIVVSEVDSGGGSGSEAAEGGDASLGGNNIALAPPLRNSRVGEADVDGVVVGKGQGNQNQNQNQEGQGGKMDTVVAEQEKNPAEVLNVVGHATA